MLERGRSTKYSAPTIAFVKRDRSLNRTKIHPNPISMPLREPALSHTNHPLTDSFQTINISAPVSPKFLPMDIEEPSTSNKGIKRNSPSAFNNSTHLLIEKHGNRFLTEMDLTKMKRERHTQQCSCWPKSVALKTIVVFSLILLICIIAILPPVLTLAVFRNKSSGGSSNVATIPSSCSSVSTCIGSETQYPITAKAILYPFDGNTRDASAQANGTPMGSSSLPVYTSWAYSGSAIQLNASFQQYVGLPYINLTSSSFTIEFWVMPVNPVLGSGLPDDFPILGQCDMYSTCLLITWRAGHIQLNFDSMRSNTTLTSSRISNTWGWTHVTIVYDAIALQQLIYVNGIIDTVSEGVVSPFQGSSSGATTTIGLGKSAMYSTTTFNGMLDQFSITRGIAKSSCEIYNDAVLAAYFRFDSVGTYSDYSASISAGFASNVLVVSGRIAEALSFSAASDSFFQSLCFPNLRQTTTFTFSLWVNPTAVAGGGTIVHVSSAQNGNGTLCINLIGMASNGMLIVQMPQNSTSATAMSGPSLIANTWTHLALVYSNRNGMRFFINGTLKNAYPNTANSLPFWTPTSAELYVTLGNWQTVPSITPTCLVGALPIVSGGFSGMIDEFRLYLTELNGEDICELANP